MSDNPHAETSGFVPDAAPTPVTKGAPSRLETQSRENSLFRKMAWRVQPLAPDVPPGSTAPDTTE